MAAIEVREDTAENDGGLDEMRNRDYRRVFTVVCQYLFDGPEAAMLAPGIPRLWTPYVRPLTGYADFGSWCRSVRATRVKKASTVWKVVCSYSSKIQRPDINQIENPLMRPADISWDTASTSQPMVRDAHAVTLRNSAGDPYDPLPEESVKTLVLRISRNQLNYNANFYLDFEDSVNDKPWLGLKKRAWRCVHIKGKREFENGIFYWKVDMQFETKRENEPPNAEAKGFPFEADESKAWVKWMLDRGFRQKKNGKLVACLDPITKQPLSTPALLDGTGLQLTPGGTPKYFGYRPFHDMNFDQLQLF